MAMNHQISSNVYDRYHGTAKAKELHSQKQHVHGSIRNMSGEEGGRSGAAIRDGFKQVREYGGPHQVQGRSGESAHRHGEISRHDRHSDRYDFAGPKTHRQDDSRFSYNGQQHGPHGVIGAYQGSGQTYQFTQITVTYSSVFSGSHFDSPEKSKEAHENFLNAVRDFIKNPNEKAYKSLNDAMVKLMDPNKFTPSVSGGAAQVSVRNLNGTTMVKINMEVTPAPTKSLEEAREDLKNAYSTRRDGEKDIADIRAEAYANYVRALSEKFKTEGTISHTNNTPTTPVFKSSVIYVVKVTQLNVTNLHELGKPKFENNPHGKFTFKNHNSFWNDYRHNHKSYVDMLKQDSGKKHTDKAHKDGHRIETNRDHGRTNETNRDRDRHRTDAVKPDKTEHKQHNKTRTDKAG